jgi:hypothetical protein
VVKTVYPRVYGERDHDQQLVLTTDGLSPRIRGTGIGMDEDQARMRFIPAYTGNGLDGYYCF